MIDHRTEERAMARSMALLSTLSTAVELFRNMRERRLGRDPSEQQPPDVVLPSLAQDLRTLDDHLIALRTGLAAADRETTAGVALVRHMNELILLGGLSRELHGIHQRLMSLYPRVREELVEDARRLQGACGDLIDSGDAVPGRIETFIEETTNFLATLRKSIRRNGIAE